MKPSGIQRVVMDRRVPQRALSILEVAEVLLVDLKRYGNFELRQDTSADGKISHCGGSGPEVHVSNFQNSI